MHIVAKIEGKTGGGEEEEEEEATSGLLLNSKKKKLPITMGYSSL